MRLPIVVWVTFFASFQTIYTLDFKGLHALVQRRIPQHSEHFAFKSLSEPGDKYIISDSEDNRGSVTVSCTSVSTCARGLYTYLTQLGNVDIWWTGSRLDQIHPTLPSVGKPMSGEAIVPFRYHFNTVTFGYTTGAGEQSKWCSRT